MNEVTGFSESSDFTQMEWIVVQLVLIVQTGWKGCLKRLLRRAMVDC